MSTALTARHWTANKTSDIYRSNSLEEDIQILQGGGKKKKKKKQDKMHSHLHTPYNASKVPWNPHTATP